MAKQCGVAIYNCETGNFDTNDQTDDWYSQSHYDNNWYHQDQTHMQQLALPRPPQMADPLAVPISGLQEVTVAMVGAAQQHSEDNKWVSLMIDSGAATHVCPPWFAPHFPLHQLEHGTGPQLRTVTNQHIELYGYRWGCMTNHSGQQSVIPFYACEVKQPILSVTGLVEQGFQFTLGDNPKLHYIKGFNSTLESRICPFFLQAEITALPKGTKLQIHNTDQGQIGMIAPTATLTPQGPADTGYAGDYWQLNTQGELVRVHRQHRKTLFTPSRTQCPVPAEQLEDYRKTTIRLKDGTTNTFEDKGSAKQSTTANVERRNNIQDQKRHNIARGNAATACNKDTAKKCTTEGDTTSDSVQTAHTAEGENNTQHFRTHLRHTPLRAQLDKDLHILQKYIMEETTGTEKAYWKRVHVEPRTAFYIPEQTHDGPDIKRLIPWRQTKVQPVGGERQHTRLIEDEWTTQPAKTSDKPWTGWTNFEEHQEFPTQLESDDEEQQQGTRAKTVQAPKQPTPQEILEHNVTHLPYRSWCPICVQARGRQNNHPNQRSKLPIIQLDFGYIKGFDDNKVHPILTAIDIQSGMIMAIQLTDKRVLFDYAVTQLQHFLIECARTTRTILQSDQEDFLTALITTVASKNGNIATRNSGAYSSQSQRGVERAHRTLFAQIRTLKAQVKQNYNRDIPMKHPLMPWIVRHSAYIYEQVRFAQQWMRKLLQQMEQRTAYTIVIVRVW